VQATVQDRDRQVLAELPENSPVYWAEEKELLGPCHVDTRRSLSNLARVLRLAGKAKDAHFLYIVASAVCDFTLGPRHPESRAVLGDLAVSVLRQGKLGVARSYYRQQLERTLAVAEWDDPEAFAPKFFLQALVGSGELRIVQERGATVEIVHSSPSAGDVHSRIRQVGTGQPWWM